MMENQIEGIVERCAPDLRGHGDHSYIVVLENDSRVFFLPNIRNAYAEALGNTSENNYFLIALMSPGDKISFSLKSKSNHLRATVSEGSLRNWTLENKFLMNEKDITISNDPVVSTVVSDNFSHIRIQSL